jgi:hypothetical protein
MIKAFPEKARPRPRAARRTSTEMAVREEEEEVRERAAPRKAAAERVKVKGPKLAPRRSDVRGGRYRTRKVLPPLCR